MSGCQRHWVTALPPCLSYSALTHCLHSWRIQTKHALDNLAYMKIKRLAALRLPSYQLSTRCVFSPNNCALLEAAN